MVHNNLKVGLFTPYDLASHGGVNNHVLNLHKSFQLAGIQSHVIGPHSGTGDSKDNSISYVGSAVPVPTKGSVARVSLSLWQNPRVKQIIKEKQFDVIHVHEPFSSVITLSALGSKVSDKTIKIATFHTFEGSYLYNIVFSKLLSKYASELDGRIAVSKPALDYINDYLPGTYKIIPNGVDIQKFRDAVPIQELSDKINLLYLGRIEKRKGLIHLLRAYKKLSIIHENLRLIVVGGGNLGKNESRFLKDNPQLDILMTGEVSDYYKEKYYKTAAMFCSPSIGQESFGIVLLEAMAAEVPVIASNIPGYASVIIHKQNGLLFEPGNSNSLYESLNNVISNNEIKNKLTKNANEFVKDFDWFKVSRQVLNFYSIVASEKNNLNDNFNEKMLHSLSKR